MQEEKTNQAPQRQKKSVSIGALLLNARNAAALSQDNIAEQLNLPLHIVKALEADDYEALPEATYVRGYLRNYARAVGINAEGLIKTFDEQHYQEPEIDQNIKSRQSYDPAILWSTAAVMSILVGLVVTWWLESNANLNQTPASQVATNQAAVQSNNFAQQEELKQSNQAPKVQELNAVAVSDSELKEQQVEKDSIEKMDMHLQQAKQEESNNSTLISLNDGTHMLTVTYIEESWTEIRDADSNTLMQGLIEPGVVRNLNGKPPFEIFLGNSPGVIVEVNGLYFDHSQYSRSNRTARFQVSSGSLN